ncbi:MAG: histidinol-phosphatase HisJ family protein [Bacteroidetes bacterium]|nr:histidinol-phosphatase HisJ family protein [Bacteroidota bacterium]
MLPDYHIHTILSDGKSAHEDYIRKAIEKNVPEIGFSDHVCIKEVGWRMDPDDIPLMVEKVTGLKKIARHDVNIRFGVEMDYIPGEDDEIASVLAILPLDYAIGSIHFIDDWNYDSDPSRYEKMNIYELFELYFSAVQMSAASGLFDIIGHCDMIKKFGHYPKRNIDHLLEKTAGVFRDSDVVIELNTNGLNKPCKDFYPSPHFLEICHRYKVPVTLSSDAHSADKLGQYFGDAIRLLKETGYKDYAVFSERKREFRKINY